MFVSFEGQVNAKSPKFSVSACLPAGSSCEHTLACTLGAATVLPLPLPRLVGQKKMGWQATEVALQGQVKRRLSSTAWLHILHCTSICFAAATLELQGVDFFVFNNDATKIQEVQGERLGTWMCKVAGGQSRRCRVSARLRAGGVCIDCKGAAEGDACLARRSAEGDACLALQGGARKRTASPPLLPAQRDGAHAMLAPIHSTPAPSTHTQRRLLQAVTAPNRPAAPLLQCSARAGWAPRATRNARSWPRRQHASRRSRRRSAAGCREAAISALGCPARLGTGARVVAAPGPVPVCAAAAARICYPSGRLTLHPATVHSFPAVFRLA